MSLECDFFDVHVFHIFQTASWSTYSVSRCLYILDIFYRFTIYCPQYVLCWFDCGYSCSNFIL